MFAKTSRYAAMGLYTVTLKDGTPVQAVRSPLPGPAVVAGYHRRVAGQRLDAIAGHYLGDATAFWRLCDAGNAMVPDSLGAADLVGVPLNAPARS